MSCISSITRLQKLSLGVNTLLNQEIRRYLGCHSAGISKIHRKTYARVYPNTLLVMPDGSSIRIRYHEPRKIIQLPLDLSTLTDEEKRIRLENRKPKRKINIVEEVEDEFDATKYLNLMKK